MQISSYIFYQFLWIKTVIGSRIKVNLFFWCCRCLCPPNATGQFCGQALYNTPITSNQHWEELAMVGVVVLAILVLVLVFVCCRKCSVRRTNKRSSNITNDTHKDIVLNSNRSPDVDFKRSSKLSNLEMNQVGNNYSFLLFSCAFLGLDL